MSTRTIQVTDAIYAYLTQNVLREPEVLAELRKETSKLAGAGMQISPEQGQFMSLLIELIGAQRTLEVGVLPATAHWRLRSLFPPMVASLRVT